MLVRVGGLTGRVYKTFIPILFPSQMISSFLKQKKMTVIPLLNLPIIFDMIKKSHKSCLILIEFN